MKFINCTNYLVLVLILMLSSCKKEATSLYDPDFGYNRPQPVVSAIEPASGYLSNVDYITVLGNNFHTSSDSNRIYFDGKPGVILAASETALQVRSASGVTGDNVAVKVAITGAELFSEPVTYKLDPALIPVSTELKDTDVIWGQFIADDGTIYVHILRDAISIGIQAINPVTGALTTIVPAKNISKFNDLLIGQDGTILSIQRSVRAIFKYNSETEVWQATYIVPGSGALDDMEIDENGYLWAVGNNTRIARFEIDTPANVELYDFTANLRGVRYYNSQLFVSGNINGEEQIYVFDIDSNNNLTNGRSYFKLTSNSKFIDKTRLTRLEIDTDGVLYVGVDAPIETNTIDGKLSYSTNNGIIQIESDGTSSFLYEGVIPGNVANLYWTFDKFLNIIYEKITTTSGGETIIVQNHRFFSVNMLEKRGAPRYGF